MPYQAYGLNKKRQAKTCRFLVQGTGLPPVAALAGEQLSTVRSYGQNAAHFSPYFKSRLEKAKTTRDKLELSLLGAGDGT